MSVLKRLREDGTWEFIGASSAGLPQVTSSDNGKILKVENGIWNKADPPITGVSDVLCYLEKPLVDENNNPVVDESGNQLTEKEWQSVVDENGDAYIPDSPVKDVYVEGVSVVDEDGIAQIEQLQNVIQTTMDDYMEHEEQYKVTNNIYVVGGSDIYNASQEAF